MSIVVNNNVASLLAQRNLSKNTLSLTQSFEKLSTGLRINRASDDAAGLSISESLRSQIRGNKQAINNVQDGINLLQIAESGLNVVNESVQRIRELCVQAANATNGTTEKEAILTEVKARILDINRIAKATRFNNIGLLDGTITNGVLQVGANSTLSTNTIDVSSVLVNSSVTQIGISFDTSLTGAQWTPDMVRSYLDQLDTAVKDIVAKRSSIGAYQNRLQSALENLTVMNENVQSSESRIRDLDIAQETANMTKLQILQQASASILSQANQMPQLALSLLGR